jgi:hypothetical protein
MVGERHGNNGAMQLPLVTVIDLCNSEYSRCVLS